MIDQQNVMVLLVGVVTFLLALFYWKHVWERRKMPPGPFPLPILGNFPQIHAEGLLPCLTKLADKYGPVYTLYLGSRPTVVMTGYQAVKEALVDLGDVFVNRGALPVFEALFQGGLSFTNGEDWSQMRHFSLLTLKDLGMGKKCSEEPLLEEARHLVDYFKNLKGEPIDPSTVLMCASSNVVAKLLVGTHYSYDDKKWMKILHDARHAFHIISSTWGQLYDMFPSIMKYLPGPHNKIFTLLKPLEQTVIECVKEHQKTLDPSFPRDYTDCFLLRIKQEEKNEKTPFTIHNLIATVFDMFLGGAEGNSLTVNFGILIILKHPEIQEKIHEEIDQVIGREREPRADDKSRMHYTNAFLHELQRYSDIFPIGFTRSTTRDLKFHGYHIPKGTNVLTLFTTVLRDPSRFATPTEFNINHFLDENKKFKRNDAFMPFAAGKRACIAESLVRMQLFIFFTVIMQKFTLKSSVDPKDLDIAPTESGLENLPPSHKIQFIPRY